MENGEFINKVADRMVEFLESSEGRFWLTDAEMRAMVKVELRRILCDELKDRKIVSIPDLKGRLKAERNFNPYTDSYEFRVGLTTKGTIPCDVYDRYAATPEKETEFMKTMEDSLKESFVYSLDKKDK